jgi:hypothetical protein
VLQSQWVQDKSVSPCVWYSAGITHVLFAHHRPGRRIHSAEESPQVLRERVLRLDAARRRRLLAVPAGMSATHSASGLALICVGRSHVFAKIFHVCTTAHMALACRCMRPCADGRHRRTLCSSQATTARRSSGVPHGLHPYNQ